MVSIESFLFQVDSKLIERFEKVCKITGKSNTSVLEQIIKNWIRNQHTKIVDSLELNNEVSLSAEAALDAIVEIIPEDSENDLLTMCYSLSGDDMSKTDRAKIRETIGKYGVGIVKYTPMEHEEVIFFHRLAISVNNGILARVTGQQKYATLLRAHPKYIKDSVAAIAGKPTRCVFLRLR